jgi:hypothetical protein
MVHGVAEHQIERIDRYASAAEALELDTLVARCVRVASAWREDVLFDLDLRSPHPPATAENPLHAPG